MLAGHEDKAALFRSLNERGVLPRTNLYYGDQGIGKFAFARAFAAFLETGSYEADPETLLDAAVFEQGESRSIGIDTIRELRNYLSQTPLKSSVRLAIVRDAEALTPDAQAALLKVVEEPPAHAFIILTATDPFALTPPLVSRLAKWYFPRLSKEALATWLHASHGVGPVKANDAAARSFGRPARALQLLGLAPAPDPERPLADQLEDEIAEEFAGKMPSRAGSRGALIRRITALRRFSLNPSLQKRAIMTLRSVY